MGGEGRKGRFGITTFLIVKTLSDALLPSANQGLVVPLSFSLSVACSPSSVQHLLCDSSLCCSPPPTNCYKLNIYIYICQNFCFFVTVVFHINCRCKASLFPQINTHIDSQRETEACMRKEAFDAFPWRHVRPHRLCGCICTCSSYLETHEAAVTVLAFSKAPCDGVFYMLPQ